MAPDQLIISPIVTARTSLVANEPSDSAIRNFHDSAPWSAIARNAGLLHKAARRGIEFRYAARFCRRSAKLWISGSIE